MICKSFHEVEFKFNYNRVLSVGFVVLQLSILMPKDSKVLQDNRIATLIGILCLFSLN